VLRPSTEAVAPKPGESGTGPVKRRQDAGATWSGTT